MRRLSLVLLLSLCPLAATAQGKGGELIPGAAIKGVEANPRVTFIVPWQRLRMQEFPLLPAPSVLDALYAPLSSRQLEQDIARAGRDAAAPP